MKIVETAQHILRAEILGIKSINALIDSADFEQAINLLSSISGKVIVTGMGKSGHVGAKIAATLASTGTPGCFVHPAEASHGDLGTIQKEDAMIIISHSGDTAELQDITLFAKKNQIITVSIVGKKDSFLGANTDIALVTGKLTEAMPHLPAPTTSTTVAMIIGDIIAGCLSVHKNFNTKQYNALHPGGLLGKSLSCIGSIVTRNNLPIVTSDTDMCNIILEITSKKYGLVVVVDESLRMIGTISDGDLRRHMQDNIMSLKAKDIMNSDPKGVHEDTFITDVIEMLTASKILTIPVLDNYSRPIGIAQLYDLIK